MKHLSALFMIILFSQMGQSQSINDPYSVLWDRVQKLEKENMTKSALEIVSTISQKAKKENHSPQLVKALLYASKYAMILEEDAQLNIVLDFKSAMAQSEFPTRNILESYLAHLYWSYFQQNRYRFYNRTEMQEKIDTTDFRTWDLNTIFYAIGDHFEASLSRPHELQQIKIDSFDEILVKEKGSEAYRPTLFDLLAHTALDFYKTGENNITRPADKFELNDPEILCEGKLFIQQKINSSDSTSLQVKALSIYQQLLDFHSKDISGKAYVEIDLERLKYIQQNAVFNNKEQQYLEVLQNTAAGLKQNENSALYEYEIARLYHEQGNTYRPDTQGKQRWKQKDALDVCESIITRFPKSIAAEKSKVLKSEILSKNVQLTLERHIPIGRPSRILVDYKNLDGIELSARKISQKEMRQLNDLYPEAEKLVFIRKLQKIEEWDAQLKNENDYQSHGMEVLLPPLANGSYIILAIPQGDTTGTFAYSPVQVTNLALLEARTDEGHSFQVIDRYNGRPIQGAALKVSYQRNYDRPSNSKNLISDGMGMVSVPVSDESWNNANILIVTKDDEAYFEGFNIYPRQPIVPNETEYSCFLFTDRSIYRPGQVLHFKGIALEQRDKVSSILSNTMVTTILKDANYQEVARQELRTNDFGSFSGTFLLPNNGLTGGHTLEISSEKINIRGYSHFSVEEYKRPKFETSFEPVTETFRLNDDVVLHGKATAYAGSTITGAKVSYTVNRVVVFPRWHYWRLPHFNDTPQIMAHGETVTDDEGRYTINFKAIPDLEADAKDLPTFTYEVTAAVTDLNGETHSASTIVNVGYHALTANIEVADMIDKKEDGHKIGISTNNLNGEFVAAKGTLKIYKLNAPDRTLRPRPWPAPDYDGFGEARFKELFPHDAHKKEDDPSTWKKGEPVWESGFDTEKSKEIALGNLKKWKSGKYVLELETKDRFGQLVKDIKRTTLFEDNDKKLADHQLFQIKMDKPSYGIGDVVQLSLLSSADDITVSLFIEKKSKIVATHKIRLQNNSKTITIPVGADDLGGFAINYSFSAYNSFRSGNLAVPVPYPPTDLQIETVTFRDKLRPGAEETWSFKIKGPKGDKVTAELLANMYDASLDAFREHNWNFDPLQKGDYYSSRYLNAHRSFGTSRFWSHLNFKDGYSYTPQGYDSFNWFGFQFGTRYAYMERMMKRSSAAPGIAMDIAGQANGIMAESEMVGEESVSEQDTAYADTQDPGKTQGPETGSEGIQARKNLQETAFFFPQLLTDEDGNVSFSFTAPEALTKWKLQLLAHTKALEKKMTTLEAVTQKELMVIPNAPRFLREGDQIVISTKIANLTEKGLSGQARIELTDALTGNPINKEILLGNLKETDFNVGAKGNTEVSWTLNIPEGMQAVQFKIMAKAGDFSDGEQNVLPVLTNRILVTETLPMWVRSNETKTFTLDKLLKNRSTSLNNHRLSLEITSNPAWYALQALPYLMEYPYDCNEQIFSRYYANALGAHVANSNPRIRAVFDQWANSDALLSNLEKNQELKSVLIQETPWLRDAGSEAEQKKRIALLFDLNKLRNDQTGALLELQRNQMSSGAWSWFKGGRENRFITQHIVAGLGHLDKLTATPGLLGPADKETLEMTKKAIGYLDDAFVTEYEEMKKRTKDINEDHLSYTQLHYLYMRSFFKTIKTSKKVDDIMAYYMGQAQKYWTKKDLYSKGLLSLIAYRSGETAMANKILKALEENSIVSDELGMYWKANTDSWYWYRAPIETQALLIEAFTEIKKDIETVDNLKIWLLKNKQTNQWKTTKATTDAIYALLLQGSDWLSVTEAVAVLIGREDIPSQKMESTKVEAGMGYFKTSWYGKEISPKMGEVQIGKKGKGIAWGALYWQYFEDLDKITPAETPLRLKKQVFLKKNTDTGEKISEVHEKTSLKVGDLIRIRIELRADRPMEFVHMKDMRAAGLEPLNVLSGYKWQDGLGYYESTKDASTNFFFDYLPQGVYVFEYDLRVGNAGDFSNGITTIQSMYAPEFSSHSEGVRILVEQGK